MGNSPTKLFGTHQAERLWAVHDPDNTGVLDRPTAMKFLKDVATAAEVPWDEEKSNLIIKRVAGDGTGRWPAECRLIDSSVDSTEKLPQGKFLSVLLKFAIESRV